MKSRLAPAPGVRDGSPRLVDPLQETLSSLRSRAADGDAVDRMLFSGNRHDAVPRVLFTDVRLTPLERNAWQVFRMLACEDGATAFPTYEELRPYLASVPCAGQASDETIARALIILRLTRWLTLVRHRRDPATGRTQGNLYLLHDEPLTPHEAIQLDTEYLELVSHALDHASKAVQRVAYHVLRELSDDPLVASRALPSRLQTLTDQVRAVGVEASEQDPYSLDHSDEEEGDQSSDSEGLCLPPSDSEGGSPSDTSDSEGGAARSSDSEVRAIPRNGRGLRIPKTSTVRTEHIYKSVRTVPRAREAAELRLPPQFARLRGEQQAGAMSALQQLELPLQQSVLDEWEARCRSPGVRNPAGYLFGLIQRAVHGQFQSWAAARSLPQAATATDLNPSAPPDQRDIELRREVGRRNIAKIRAMLGTE